ncbi:MAG TPA: T9SS type A sorting domain-containing protein, partial [Saprospiraceae bacterium]|nr:T9SS type A sorting domain-containing protein [Saprospiraceae bacterium]
SFTITDACGNATTCAVVHRGRIPSQITGICPDLDQSGFTCLAEVPAPNPEAIIPYFTGGDGQAVTVLLSGVVGAENDCGFEVTYEYTILDNCGNTRVCKVKYSGGDNLPPTGSCPGPITVASLNEVPAPNIEWIESLYTDGCGSGKVQVGILGVTTTGDGCAGFTVTHSYYIVDPCGNTAYCDVEYIVPGGVGLVGDCPSPITDLHCWADVPGGLEAISIVEESYASADGSPVTVLFLGTTVINNYCTFTYRHIYQVIESCSGERRICILTFTGVDDIAPEGVCPEGETGLSCLSEAPEPDPIAVASNYTDNCSTPFGYLINRTVEGDDCIGFTVTDFYRVYDDCDNFVECYVTHSGGGPNNSCPDCITRPIGQQLPNAQITDPASLIRMNLSMTVYPNPTSGELFLEFNKLIKGAAVLTVRNVFGQQVIERSIELDSQQYRLDLGQEGLASGTYLISIRTGEGVVTQKVVFNRI